MSKFIIPLAIPSNIGLPSRLGFTLGPLGAFHPGAFHSHLHFAACRLLERGFISRAWLLSDCLTSHDLTISKFCASASPQPLEGKIEEEDLLDKGKIQEEELLNRGFFDVIYLGIE